MRVRHGSKAPNGWYSIIAKICLKMKSPLHEEILLLPSMTDKRVLLVVPAYNESASIERTIDSIRAHGYEFVVINDGSTDDTEEILCRIGAPHIELVQNLGIGGAVQTGYLYARDNGYDVAVQFDGDGQHDAGYVEDLVEPIIAGRANMTIGSRFVGNESEFKSSLARRAGISLLSGTLKLATGKRVKDVTSGFRAIDSSVIALFAGNYPGDYPEPESIAYALAHGYAVEEVPVAMHERAGGKSSIAGLDIVWYMVKVGMSVLLHGSYGARRS